MMLFVWPLAAAAAAVSAEQGAAGSIVGSVWDANDRGVPETLVRLRNLGTGDVIGTARADRTGQFTMRPVPPGNYLVEVVRADGSVIAVGQPFAVAPGETVATFVRLPASPPWFAGFFSNAATAAVATAASLGVTAMGRGAQPTSPQR